jgi:hypothetical protein
MFKDTLALKLFGLAKIPLIFAVNPKVREMTAQKCVIEIPLNWMTRNHLRSMYFGALAIGADCAGGLFVLHKAKQFKGVTFNLIFKDFKANFLKRPEASVLFICTDQEGVEALLTEAATTKLRVTRPLRIEARLVTTLELVAEFELGLSLKVKS